MSDDGAKVASGRKFSWPVRAFWAALWLLIGVAVAWAATFIAWGEVWAALRKADPVWVGLAILANLCGYPFWAQALRLYVPSGEPRPYWTIMGVLAISSAAIQCLSIFAGAATAVVLLVRRVGLSTGAMISVLTLEQLTTGIVKALIVGVAVLSASAPFSLKAAGATLLAGVAGAFLALVWAAHSGAGLARLGLRHSGWFGRALTKFADWTAHLEALRHPLRYTTALLCVVARRAAETIAILCVQKASGLPVSVELALLIIAAVSLATIIPGPPGNIGMYEAAVVLAYSWGGVGAETAVAAALLQHFAFLAAAFTPGGLLLIFWRPQTRRPPPAPQRPAR